MAGIYDFHVKQGQTYTIPFIYQEPDVPPATEGDPPTPGVRIDISRFEGRGWVVRRVTDSTPLGELVVTITDGIEGELSITVNASMTTALPVKGNTFLDINEFQYDVELFNPTPGMEEDVIRFLNGKLLVSPESTKGE